MTIREQLSNDIVKSRVELLFALGFLLLLQIFLPLGHSLYVNVFLIGLVSTIFFILPYFVMIEAWKKKKVSDNQMSKTFPSIIIISLILTVAIILAVILISYSANDRILSVLFFILFLSLGLVVGVFDTKFPQITKNATFLVSYSICMVLLNVILFGLLTSINYL